ncbi:MAG: cupin domain-containing protein [Candidatus Omnitrophica bacterium]|nr:cupin domain-containing protein [Candidatus Omnitrophota bacterium]
MKDISAIAAKLSRFVSYQAGSVVSREIIRRDVGTITVFAFDKGQGLSEHTAPFDAFIYIVDGEASIMINGDLHTVKSGEFIIMPANKPHAVRAVKKFKMMLVMIRGKA